MRALSRPTTYQAATRPKRPRDAPHGAVLRDVRGSYPDGSVRQSTNGRPTGASQPLAVEDDRGRRAATVVFLTATF